MIKSHRSATPAPDYLNESYLASTYGNFLQSLDLRKNLCVFRQTAKVRVNGILPKRISVFTSNYLLWINGQQYKKLMPAMHISVYLRLSNITVLL